MYLELRNWKGTWLAGQPATATRRFHLQEKEAARLTLHAGTFSTESSIAHCVIPSSPRRSWWIAVGRLFDRLRSLRDP